MHLNLPHVPWKYLPSGTEYGPVGRHLYPYPMNGLADVSPGDRWALREGCELLVRLMAPMMPHLAEELWRCLGRSPLLADEPWPEPEAALLVEETVTVAAQVNGKLRSTIVLPRDSQDQVAEDCALADPAVQRALAGKVPRRVVVVRNRVVNVVV